MTAHDNVGGATTLIGAIKTIVIADAVVSLDNVIAVAGAARARWAWSCSVSLISIPIIVWGSKFVLKLMDRFPVVITLGAGLLGWIAGDASRLRRLCQTLPGWRAVLDSLRDRCYRRCFSWSCWAEAAGGSQTGSRRAPLVDLARKLRP